MRIAPLLMLAAAALTAADRPYRAAALETARWLRATAIQTPAGLTWAADPSDPKSVSYSLYSGTPGVILFFLELSRATGSPAYLADARAGANQLVTQLDSIQDPGLYTGLAGAAFALHEVYLQTKDPFYRAAVERAVARVAQSASASTTDIISGAAGQGLFLLYAHQHLQSDAALQAARRLGDQLLEAGRPQPAGLKWAMNEKFPRLMPNFSHGTAGVAYFLASLHQRLADLPSPEGSAPVDTRYLDAAIAGAKYLQANANQQCFVFHHEPGGEDLYYLSWCHGPAGTARLFDLLDQIQRNSQAGEGAKRAAQPRVWRQWVLKSADSLMRTGIPEKRTPGFWNNVSQCCGSAGIAEFFVELHRQSPRRKDYLAFARRLANDLLDRATKDQKGMRWLQAEHRAKPGLLAAQTGYMQGAAGIGLMLLHLDDPIGSRAFQVVFPDAPVRPAVPSRPAAR